MSVTHSYSTVPVFRLHSIREDNLSYPLPTCGDESQAAAIMKAYLWDKECEHLALLLVDGQTNFLGICTVSIGGIAGLQTSVRDCFKHALLHRASAFVLGHNHPSGALEPSEQDITFTKAVSKVGKLMGCPLMDHVIVSSGVTSGTYSFLSHGRMET